MVKHFLDDSFLRFRVNPELTLFVFFCFFQMVKHFMDDSFLKLRSAEDTYNLLQKFKEIQVYI